MIYGRVGIKTLLVLGLLALRASPEGLMDDNASIRAQ